MKKKYYESNFGKKSDKLIDRSIKKQKWSVPDDFEHRAILVRGSSFWLNPMIRFTNENEDRLILDHYFTGNGWEERERNLIATSECRTIDDTSNYSIFINGEGMSFNDALKRFQDERRARIARERKEIAKAAPQPRQALPTPAKQPKRL